MNQQLTHVANPVRVNAVRIMRVTSCIFAEGKESPDLVLALEDGRNFEADSSMTARYTPMVGDYVVTQEDGYTYLNPKDVFERKYKAVAVDPIEQEIQAKGLTAPRVTPTDIEANIDSEHYFTAADGVIGAERSGATQPTSGPSDALGLLTFCVLVLQNGFTVTGESACASPENFDAELGKKIARQNAISKVWPLMGYALKDQLHRAAQYKATPLHPRTKSA